MDSNHLGGLQPTNIPKSVYLELAARLLPFVIEDKPTHTSDDHRQDDHTRDRAPKAFHRTTQDVTSKKICAQGITIAWGQELIATVNFHRIVEHERWRRQGDRTENQEAPEARIDCSGGA